MDKMKLDFQDRVAILKFNHPEVMNAVGVEMLEDFAAAMRDIKDPANGARCLLLTGEGRGFCSGANLSDRAANPARTSGDSLRSAYHPLLLGLRARDMRGHCSDSY